MADVMTMVGVSDHEIAEVKEDGSAGIKWTRGARSFRLQCINLKLSTTLFEHEQSYAAFDERLEKYSREWLPYQSDRRVFQHLSGELETGFFKDNFFVLQPPDKISKQLQAIKPSKIKIQIEEGKVSDGTGKVPAGLCTGAAYYENGSESPVEEGLTFVLRISKQGFDALIEYNKTNVIKELDVRAYVECYQCEIDEALGEWWYSRQICLRSGTSAILSSISFGTKEVSPAPEPVSLLTETANHSHDIATPTTVAVPQSADLVNVLKNIRNALRWIAFAAVVYVLKH